MKRSERNGFWLICVVLTFLTTVLVGGNVAVIAFRGMKSLPECISNAETLFAIQLSIKSACISSLLCFLLAIPSAYTLTRTNFPCRSVIEIILELTMARSRMN